MRYKCPTGRCRWWIRAKLGVGGGVVYSTKALWNAERRGEGQGLNSTAMPLFRAMSRHLGRKRTKSRETSSIVGTDTV